jgi:predicted ATPase/class 3 adenylate cyclase
MKRKLAAIFSADVQGYSRLMGEDEEATIRTLTLYREVMTALIQQHRGRVIDSPGDNLLAEFGSVVDAVQCAVTIQQELGERNASLPSQRQMHFRIGLNLGDVIVEEERIYGDGVNIAARLEGLAEGGGICISGTVYDQVEGKLPLTYESLGEQTVKNITRPVRVYRVRFASSPVSLLSTQSSETNGQPPAEKRHEATAQDERKPLSSGPLPAVLVGRDAELMQLQGYIERAARGERQIVFVTGEPGIGKTTVVNAFVENFRGQKDFRLTYGQCVEHYGAGDAYLPLLEAAHRLCRSPGGERIIAALQKHAPTWLSQMPGVLSATEFDALQQRVQGFTHERMLREMAEALEVHTAKRGIVVILEDLHWSDTATLEWLAYTARRREPAKLLILGTYRPTEVLTSAHPLRGVAQELQASGLCEEVRLAPLTEDAVEQYLSRRFTTAALPTGLSQTIYRRTGGNPLFIVNMVDYLARQGVMVEEGGKWTVQAATAEAVEQGVPDTLRQLIERQIDRLHEAEQRMLEVASVAGVEFTAAAVAAGLQFTVDEVEEGCEKLARRGQLIHEQGVEEWPDGTVGSRYRFLHALYQNVLYERTAPGRRVRLHKQIGERREAAFGERAGEIATELAVHFEKGREMRRAISYLERAGRNALQRSANTEAVRHLTHALTLLARLPVSEERTRQELVFHLALGTPLLALRGYGAPEVRRHYQQARSLCRELDDPPDLFPVLWGLWVSHAVAGELSAAAELGSQLFQFAGHIGDSDLSFQAHHALWTTLLARGDLLTCQFHIEQGLRLYQTDRHYAQTFVYGGHDPGACCRIHGGFLYWLLGYPDRALQLSQKALVLSKDLSHGQTLAWALSGNAMVHQFRGESTAAQKAAEEAIALSTEQQFALWAAYSPAVLGWALVAQGKKEQGLAQIQAGLVALRATGTGIWQSQFLALLAGAYGEARQIQESLRAIDEALVASAHNGERFYEAELYRLKGEVLLAQEVKEESQKAKVKGQKSKVSEAQSSVLSPQSLPSPDPLGEAEACFQKAIAIAREQRAKSWELRAATSLARLWQSQGKLNEAREQLEEVYAWFTEGFDTKDLQDAAVLLGELGSTKEKQKSKRETEDQEHERAGDEGGRRQRNAVRITHYVSRTMHSADTPHSALRTPHMSSLAPNSFRHEGEYWTLVFDGVVCRLRDMRGLHYLAYLLQHPNDDIHAFRLATGDEASAETQHSSARPPTADALSLSTSDSGEMLDAQARATYKQRVEDLQAELEEAVTFHDQGRIDKLREELDFLTNELAHAVGLGGRARRVGSPVERARTTVTKAIKNALKKISEHHALLGQYLTRTIKTGTFCAYAPDPRSPVSWQF